MDVSAFFQLGRLGLPQSWGETQLKVPQNWGNPSMHNWENADISIKGAWIPGSFFTGNVLSRIVHPSLLKACPQLTLLTSVANSPLTIHRPNPKI